MSTENSSNLPEFVLSVIACPTGNQNEPMRQEGEFLICDSCNKAYPIINGIPHLLPESGISWPIQDSEKI